MTPIYPIEYEATIYNDIIERNEVVHGVTFGSNYAEGMGKIEKYYGDDLINVNLHMLEEDEVYEFEINGKKPPF